MAFWVCLCAFRPKNETTCLRNSPGMVVVVVPALYFSKGITQHRQPTPSHDHWWVRMSMCTLKAELFEITRESLGWQELRKATNTNMFLENNYSAKSCWKWWHKTTWLKWRTLWPQCAILFNLICLWNIQMPAVFPALRSATNQFTRSLLVSWPEATNSQFQQGTPAYLDNNRLKVTFILFQIHILGHVSWLGRTGDRVHHGVWGCLLQIHEYRNIWRCLIIVINPLILCIPHSFAPHQ